MRIWWTQSWFLACSVWWRGGSATICEDFHISNERDMTRILCSYSMCQKKQRIIERSGRTWTTLSLLRWRFEQRTRSDRNLSLYSEWKFQFEVFKASSVDQTIMSLVQFSKFIQTISLNIIILWAVRKIPKNLVKIYWKSWNITIKFKI